MTLDYFTLDLFTDDTLFFRGNSKDKIVKAPPKSWLMTGARLNPFLAVILYFFMISFPCFASTEIEIETYERSAWDIGRMEVIAVVDVMGRNPGIGEQLSDMIAKRIAEQKFLRVMDRKETNRTLEKAGIHIHDTPDLELMRKIANILDVDGVICGKIDANFYTGTRYRTFYYGGYWRGNGKKRGYRYIPYNVPYTNRTGYVGIDLHFYSREKDCEIGVVKDSATYYKDYDYAYIDPYLPSDQEMLFRLADEVIGRYIYKFTPHFTIRKRKLENQDDPGVKLALAGKWKEASEIWETRLQANPNDFVALKNLGIYSEKNGDLKTAIQYYRKAQEAKPHDATLTLYIAQAQNADLASERPFPVNVSDDTPIFKIGRMDSKERVFITSGNENGVKPGDEFWVIKKLPLFDEKITEIIGERYYRIGVFRIKRVFDGVSLGELTEVAPDHEVTEGAQVISGIKM